jgi:hypothetical protein
VANTTPRRNFFRGVSGFDGLRGYTGGEQFVSDDWSTIGPGGTEDQFLGEMLEQYREMMSRMARAVTHNDYDADDVIQRLCIRFVVGGIPAGLRENPPAYLTGCVVKEAKNVQQQSSRARAPLDTLQTTHGRRLRPI